jgi:hypothetical protein
MMEKKKIKIVMKIRKIRKIKIAIKIKKTFYAVNLV